jgi:hypothetical protein
MSIIVGEPFFNVRVHINFSCLNIISLTLLPFVTVSFNSSGAGKYSLKYKMKRARVEQESSPAEYTLCEENFGSPLEHQRSRNGLITPPPEGSQRPSKLRRQGSKILSILRSLTNSGT